MLLLPAARGMLASYLSTHRPLPAPAEISGLLAPGCWEQQWPRLDLHARQQCHTWHTGDSPGGSRLGAVQKLHSALRKAELARLNLIATFQAAALLPLPAATSTLASYLSTHRPLICACKGSRRAYSSPLAVIASCIWCTSRRAESAGHTHDSPASTSPGSMYEPLGNKPQAELA